jgi:hypothetical protein
MKNRFLNEEPVLKAFQPFFLPKWIHCQQLYCKIGKSKNCGMLKATIQKDMTTANLEEGWSRRHKLKTMTVSCKHAQPADGTTVG